jgi:carbamoyltransferase
MWIAGIALGHNAGVCLLKDGEVIFSIEEERLSRTKHDGGPLLSMMKILDYTDKIDYLVVTNLITNPNDVRQHTVLEYTREPLYQGLARRLGLIEQPDSSVEIDTQSPQVINMFDNHHRLHSAIAFYNSGFETAVSVIVDSSGSCTQFGSDKESGIYFETESIFDCSYTKGIKTLYKKMGCDKGRSYYIKEMHDEQLDEKFILVADEGAGIGKVWDAVTDYCGFHINDAGKTMGLSAFGSPNRKLPVLFRGDTSNKDLIKAQYPYRTSLNIGKEEFEFLDDMDWNDDLSESNLRRDMAYKCQTETEEQVLNLIIKASEMGDNKNVVLSGGYALNCVSNYYYLDKLNELGINLYVEPNSSDAGTATGAALLYHYMLKKENKVTLLDEPERKRNDNLFLGPNYNYTVSDIHQKVEKYNDCYVNECTAGDVAQLIKDRHIVSIFQGRSESGPRALGNRSILFNPTVEDGKDIVNNVKGREYFRPFAGTVLKEYAHEWFDMKGLEESPNMMYAVDVIEDWAGSIPSVLHIDNTCRIQTVTEEGNKHFYRLIEEFHKITGVPILFNTSFNVAGDPLVETIDDALQVLNDTEMEYCYMPELHILIKLHNGARI